MTFAEQVADTIRPPAATLPAPPAKHCGCGISHDVFEWAALEYVGVMCDESVGTIELRNCPCGSTLAVEVAQ